jgi:DNA-binding CsgD family transcriptional regulator
VTRALAALLDQSSTAALVVAACGTIRFANAVARRRLEGLKRELPSLLAERPALAAPHPGLDVTRVELPGAGTHYLVVERCGGRCVAERAHSAAHLWALSAREEEVLRAVCEGLTNKEVGERLGIAEVTVESHMTRLLAKANARSRLELVVKAMR